MSKRRRKRQFLTFSIINEEGEKEGRLIIVGEEWKKGFRPEIGLKLRD